MSARRNQAVALAEQVCDVLSSVDHFDRISLGAVDNIISDLRTLRSLMGRCSDVDLAIGYLEKMKRPRADKPTEGQRAKDAAFGGQEVIAYWRRPRIEHSFDRNQHSAVVITVNTAGEGHTDQLGTYFRLRVANNGRDTARGCEVAIETLVFVSPQGRGARLASITGAPASRATLQPCLASSGQSEG
jgi:hypothetical protein